MQILRSLKTLGRVFLPELVKRRLRGRLHGYRPARVAIPHRFVPRADGTVRVEIHGLRPLTIPGSAVEIFRFHLLHNGESIEEFAALLEHARTRDGVLFDVGANHGVFSLAYCAARPANRAFAFEPAAEPLADVVASALASGVADRVEPVHAWVGEGGEAVTGGIDPSGFFNRGLPGGTRTVPAATIDGHVALTGVVPTVIKIDVDGAELGVLRGASATLAACRPTVFMELHYDLLERQRIAPATVVDLLERAGYRFEDCIGTPLPARRVVDAPVAVLRFVAHPV